MPPKKAARQQHNRIKLGITEFILNGKRPNALSKESVKR